VQPGGAFNSIESTIAATELFSAQESVLLAAKNAVDQKDNLADKLQEGLKQQKIAVSLWDYEVEKLKSSMDESFGNSINLLRREIGRILEDAVSHKFEQIEPLLVSNLKLFEVNSMIEKALSDAENSLSSNKREEILGSKRLVEAVTQRVKESYQGVITQIDSKLILENVSESAERIISFLANLKPEEFVHLEFQSSSLIQKVKDYDSKKDFVNAYKTALELVKFKSYDILALLARYYLLGYSSLAEGVKISPDPAAAVRWASKACAAGNPDGDLCLLMGKTNIENLQFEDEGKSWLLKGAEQNHPGCIGYLAVFVPLPEEEKAQWLNKAIELNDKNALFYVAERYSSINSKDVALEYYIKAAKQGHPQAQLKLVELTSNDDAASFEWLLAAAQQVEDAEAFFKVGRCYHDGKGCAKDIDESVIWYRKAANLGHARAQYVLATLLETRDMDESNKWYEEAANQGIPEAQIAVGLKMKSVNLQQSISWLEKAASKKNPSACLELAKLKKLDKKFEEALSLLFVACNAGVAEAHFELALMYISGLGVPEDETKAEAYLLRSADLGFILAREIRKNVSSTGAAKKALLKFVNSVKMSIDSSAVLMPEPVMIGNMCKLSKKGKNTSHKRLFVLHGPFLSYYKDVGDSYASNRILLRGARVDRLVTLDKTGEYHFLLADSKENELHIFSDDLASIDAWVERIERAILFYTFVDTKSQYHEIQYKPDDGMLPEENRFVSTMRESVVKKGWLQKQGGKFKSWNKRFFILVPDNLFYFKDENYDSLTEGGIPLEYAQIIVNAKETLGIEKKHCIVIMTNYRNYFIDANSAEEMIDWANEIEKVIDRSTARSAVNFVQLKSKVQNSEAFRASLYTRASAPSPTEPDFESK
jgi:TPR repeat protein